MGLFNRVGRRHSRRVADEVSRRGRPCRRRSPPTSRSTRSRSARLDWGYTNFYQYHWAGRVDSAAAAGNDTIWTADQVGTNYGGDRDTDDWVSVIAEDVADRHRRVHRHVVDVPHPVLGTRVVTGDRPLGMPPHHRPRRPRRRHPRRVHRAHRHRRRRGLRRTPRGGRRCGRDRHRHRAVVAGVAGRRDHHRPGDPDADDGPARRRPRGVVAARTGVPSADPRAGSRRPVGRSNRARWASEFRCGPGYPVVLPFEIPLPADAPPTAAAVHSSINWFVQARMMYAGFTGHMLERVRRPIVVVNAP